MLLKREILNDGNRVFAVCNANGCCFSFLFMEIEVLFILSFLICYGKRVICVGLKRLNFENARDNGCSCYMNMHMFIDVNTQIGFFLTLPQLLILYCSWFVLFEFNKDWHDDGCFIL